MRCVQKLRLSRGKSQGFFRILFCILMFTVTFMSLLMYVIDDIQIKYVETKICFGVN